jgi:Protein of unknown function (DUF3305)
VSRQQPLQRLPVGVVVERRRAQSPWVDFVWRPVTVLPGVPDTAPWTALAQDEDATTFYAGARDVELFAASSGFYRDNLASGEPALWVVLRPSGLEPPFEIVAVTADPHEGEAFTQAGDDLVEPVVMPPPVRAAIEAFVREHHIDDAFFKRTRDEANPEALARRAPTSKSDADE